MKRLSELAYVYLAIVVVTLVFIISALLEEVFATKLVPLLIASPVFALSLIGLIQEIFAKGKLESEEETKLKLRDYLRVMGWIVGFGLAISLVGFFIGIPLFVFGYMKAHGIGWLTAIIYAAVLTVAIWGIIELGFNIILYRGLLLQALG